MWHFLNIFFAKKCEFCGRLNFRLCPECLAKITKDYRSQDGVPYFLSYQDEKIRKFIWKFKYGNETVIAKDLAPIFGDFVFDLIENDLKYHGQKIYLVPAPMTNDPKRYRLRNHMLVLANETAIYLKNLGFDVYVYDCLKKSGHKRSAMILGKKKRTENIKKTLSLKDTPPPGGLIIALDDVTTTGTTLKYIKKILEAPIKSKIIKKQAWVQVVALAH